MRSLRTLVALTAALAVSTAVLAHGTGNKVIGTVTAVHASMNHIEVKTKDGHTVGITVNDSTKYTRAGKTVAFSDLKEGMRVVVTTTGTGDQRTATEVRLGAASTKAASTTHKH